MTRSEEHGRPRGRDGGARFVVDDAPRVALVFRGGRELEATDRVLNVELVAERKRKSRGAADEQKVVRHTRRQHAPRRHLVGRQPCGTRLPGLVRQHVAAVGRHLLSPVLDQRLERLPDVRLLVFVKHDAPAGLRHDPGFDVGRKAVVLFEMACQMCFRVQTVPGRVSTLRDRRPSFLVPELRCQQSRAAVPIRRSSRRCR